RIKRQINKDWKPNAIFLTSLNSIWWQDAKETIRISKELLPDIPVYLGGIYPAYDLDHAKQHSGANFIVNGFSQISSLPTDLSLYEVPPKSAGIYFYYKNEIGILVPRPINELVNEIQAKIKLGVLEFVFFDEEIKGDDKSIFVEFLNLIVANRVK